MGENILDGDYDKVYETTMQALHSASRESCIFHNGESIKGVVTKVDCEPMRIIEVDFRTGIGKTILFRKTFPDLQITFVSFRWT